VFGKSIELSQLFYRASYFSAVIAHLFEQRSQFGIGIVRQRPREVVFFFTDGFTPFHQFRYYFVELCIYFHSVSVFVHSDNVRSLFGHAFIEKTAVELTYILCEIQGLLIQRKTAAFPSILEEMSSLPFPGVISVSI
jgi:hypothetical protein